MFGDTHRQHQVVTSAAAVIVVVLAALLSGCAAVDPKPFSEFRDGALNLRAGTSVLLATDLDQTREGFLEWLTTHSVEIPRYQLKQPGEPGVTSAEMVESPWYYKFRDASRAFTKMNDAFVRYANLLVDLSGGSLISDETIDKLATDLNGNLQDASKELVELRHPIDSDATEAIQKAIKQQRNSDLAKYAQAGGLISAAAAHSFKAYLEHKRKGELKDALQSVQLSVESYSGLAVLALQRMYVDIDSEYRRKWGDLAKAIANEKRATQKRALVNELLSLNEQTDDTIVTLTVLGESYAQLPKAHEDLVKGLDDDGLTRSDLRLFYDRARHSYDLYRTLTKSKDDDKKGEK